MSCFSGEIFEIKQWVEERPKQNEDNTRKDSGKGSDIYL